MEEPDNARNGVELPSHYVGDSTDSPESLNLLQFNSVLNSNDRVVDLVLSNFNSEVEVLQDILPLLVEDNHHPALDVTVPNAKPSKDATRSPSKIFDVTNEYNDPTLLVNAFATLFSGISLPESLDSHLSDIDY
ncbi:hypothetical protein Trydic_g10954 [Trypoxylus dichotomus]